MAGLAPHWQLAVLVAQLLQKRLLLVGLSGQAVAARRFPQGDAALFAGGIGFGKTLVFFGGLHQLVAGLQAGGQAAPGGVDQDVQIAVIVQIALVEPRRLVVLLLLKEAIGQDDSGLAGRRGPGVIPQQLLAGLYGLVALVGLFGNQRLAQQAFGFYLTETSAERTNPFLRQTGGQNFYQRARNLDNESLMLTGDLNLADVEWVVQYRIDDPYKYLFKVRNPELTMRDLTEAAMRQVVGDRTVNEVLTIGRTEIATTLEELIQDVCTEYSLGVRIDQVVLQDVNPPEAVKAAFNEVNQAQQEKETLINQAKAEYNKVVPKARGEAEETIQKAEGYATERVNKAQGEVSRFNALYSEYVKAQEVTQRRIFLETMARVLPRLGNVIVTDENGQNVLPLLNLDGKSVNLGK